MTKEQLCQLLAFQLMAVVRASKFRFTLLLSILSQSFIFLDVDHGTVFVAISRKDVSVYEGSMISVVNLSVLI